MTHIVLFKFKEKIEDSILSNTVVKTYDLLKNEHKVIKDYKYNLNVMDIDANMDLILFVDLGDNLPLENYINHPEHKIFLENIKKLEPISKSVIDI
ncbi:Dabb family protein [Peptostreptococcus faecalis]|uniref:Dabb family protein n=1 Tax=Peptostreptococcus faecalis TaxID=2045015 RepID=UPI000C79B22F|nr:Dabb family protein [Peptostreptococcus faecalis]